MSQLHTLLHARAHRRTLPVAGLILRRHRPRAITPTVTRWPPAARAAGWTLLAMTATAFMVFGLG